MNEQVICDEIRLIGAEGENVGLITPENALDLALDAGLDLVEISPNAEPPVCKIMDFGKFSIHIDNNSRPFLDNLVLDFTKTGLGEEFIFNNPNVTASCGCGVSMTFNPV